MTARAALLAAALAAFPGAAAADAKSDARALADQGRRYHDAGDYDRAVIAFRRAYELAPSPALLFNLGQSYRLKGACDDAVIMYRSYLKTEPPAEHRKLTEAHLATVEQCMQTKPALRPAAATGPTSAPRLDAKLGAERGGGGLRTGGVLLAVGGGLLVGVATYYALDAREASQEIEDAYEQGARWRDIEDIDARGRRSSSLATGFAIAGGAAAVGGAVMYVVGTRAGARRDRPTMSISPGPSGAAMRLAWAF